VNKNITMLDGSIGTGAEAARAGTNAARATLRAGGGSRSGGSSARAQRMKSSRSSGASWSWVASRAAISREGRRASPSI
jgi:hypothetical protein